MVWKYKFGDEVFTSRKKALETRKLLNISAKKGDVNLVNKIFKHKGKYIVRATTKKL